MCDNEGKMPFFQLNPSDANLTLIQGFYCVGAWSRSLFYYGMAFIALCLCNFCGYSLQ